MKIILSFIRLLYRPFIHLWLFLYGIQNYTINKNNIVDVDEEVYLQFSKFLFYIPIQFGKIKGDFCCDSSRLLSLKGCPQIVYGSFSCSNTNIISLVGGPHWVGLSYSCNNNLKLKSLLGCPQFIGRDFIVTQCNIETLEHSPLEVGNHIYLLENPIMYLEGFNTVFGGKFEFYSKKFKILEMEQFYDGDKLIFSYSDINSVEIKNLLDEKLPLKDEKKEIRKVKI